MCLARSLVLKRSIVDPNIRFSIIRDFLIAVKCCQSLADRIGRQKIWSLLNSIARATAAPALVFGICF
jgi:hypothetical protein